MKAQKEVALAMGEAVEARCEAVVAREVAKGVEDVAAVAVDDAYDIDLQVGFKILRQALLQIAPDFNIEALDALVTMDMINAIVLEAKAKHGPGQANVDGMSSTI